ncbi:MAG: polysaccharide biosynthesis C-terminal domain-containing protein, partial [Oscillospiraceae bacterium]
NLVPAFTNLLGKSALPNVTAAWTRQDKPAIKLNIESVIRMTMLIAAPAGFGIAFLSQPILALLYHGNEGVIFAAAPSLTILGIAAVFLALVTPVNAVLQGIGRVDLPVKFLFTGAIVKLVLNLVLVGMPQINIKGAAISTLACYVIITFLSLSKLKQICGINLNVMSIMIKPALAGGGCGLMALLSHKIIAKFITSASIVTVLSIIVAGISYILLLALLNAISKDDILMLPKGKKILHILLKLKIVR